MDLLGILIVANYGENNSIEFGLISGFSSENYRVDITYTFQVLKTLLTLLQLLVGVTMDFDRFSRNRRRIIKD